MSKYLNATPFTTAYQTVSVRRDNDIVAVFLDGVESSALHLADPTYLEFEYMQHCDLVVRTQVPGALRALHLGAAACALARALDAQYADAQQTCVDIDGELMRWARAAFALPRSPRLKLREADAAAVLAGLHRPRYNVIIRDVFLGGVTPIELTETDALRRCREALLPGGVFLANASANPGMSMPEVVRWHDLFPHVIAISDPKVWRHARRGNVILAGSDTPFDCAAIEVGLRRLPLPARLYRQPRHFGDCG